MAEEEDRLPAPAEQAALDRPWRVWAATAIGTFVLVSLAFGFVLLPTTDGSGTSFFISICRAIGIPGFGEDESQSASLASAGPVSEVTWDSGTVELVGSASSERGAAIASEVCATCHGADGIGIDPSFPNLAGQSSAALFKQLQDFSTLSRTSGQAAIMATFAQALDTQQMADVAAYYASRSPVDRIVAPAAVPVAIKTLATIGDPARALPPCESCHGHSRSGPEGTPMLTGQSAAYLEQQLDAFATGERNNDLFERMRSIAAVLTPEERHHLAIYYGGTPTPHYRD